MNDLMHKKRWCQYYQCQCGRLFVCTRMRSRRRTDGRHTSDGVRMILHQAQRLGHGQIGLVRASDNSEAAVARALIGQQVLSHSEA